MDSISLPCESRDPQVKAARLRRDGKIPAEYYGNGVKNHSLALDYQTFRRVYKKAGDNTIIDLQIANGGEKKVLVQRVDYDPRSGQFLYVEFINIRMDEEVTTHVPIVLEGQAPAVKEMGGILIQSLDEIEIRCLPKDLLHEVKVDISSLVDFHHSIHVSDIQLPSSVTCLTDGGVTVATVSAPAQEVEESPTEERTVEDVEVASDKGKAETEEEAA